MTGQIEAGKLPHSPKTFQKETKTRPPKPKKKEREIENETR